VGDPETDRVRVAKLQAKHSALDTRRLFDEMSSRQSKKASSADGGDRISGLPDEVLHRVLSHLPAPEAARTSVLAAA